MCLLTAGTHILPLNYGVKYLSPNPKQLFKLKCIVCSVFWKANILKVEFSLIKIGELLRKLWSLRSCFNILPPGALTPQGIEGAMKRDMSKHWCTLQWCASRGWFIAHGNWTSRMALHCIRTHLFTSNHLFHWWGVWFLVKPQLKLGHGWEIMSTICTGRTYDTKIMHTFLCVSVCCDYIIPPGGRLNKKDGLTRYGDSHVKDKTS